jgi:hypothetical protein
MKMNLQNIEDELKHQKRNLELLNFLESKCEGLENLLCKNVINIISNKIDLIENRFKNKNVIKRNPQNFALPEKNISNADGEKIEKLNNNLDIIKNNFDNIYNAPDSNSGEIIRKKIEENYRLLDELERTNRPIFTKTTELSNIMNIEDKLKEMDNKVSSLCSIKNIKNTTGDKEKNNIVHTINRIDEIKTNTYIPFYLNPKFNENPANNKKEKELEIEKKKKELYDKLNFTETKIKKIAGNILKNF